MSKYDQLADLIRENEQLRAAYAARPRRGIGTAIANFLTILLTIALAGAFIILILVQFGWQPPQLLGQPQTTIVASATAAYQPQPPPPAVRVVTPIPAMMDQPGPYVAPPAPPPATVEAQRATVQQVQQAIERDDPTPGPDVRPATPFPPPPTIDTEQTTDFNNKVREFDYAQEKP
jgi:hypothetical protein